MIPTLEALVARHGTKLENLIVVADAGILSAQNCLALEALGFNFIVGSKTSSAKRELLQGLEEDAPTKFIDGQIFERTRLMKGRDLPTTKRRVVYQYKKKRADRDLKVLEDQKRVALTIVDTPSRAKKARFVRTSKGAKPVFNEELYEQSARLAGIKGYVTNLPKSVASGTQIVAWYSNLFQIERSFRMSKSDLNARPFYHHKEDAIYAHLVVVFTALTLSTYLEQKTGVTRKKLINQLEPLKDSIIRIGSATHTIKTETPPRTQHLISNLKEGY